MLFNPSMNPCTNHPDTKGVYRCEKYGVDLCEKCIKCRDPELYCKHRTACAIHFLEKEAKREKGIDKPETG